MPDVNFQIEAVEALTFAAAPLLSFKLRMTNAAGEEPIHSGLLRCQI